MITKTYYYRYFKNRPWPLLISINLLSLFIRFLWFTKTSRYSIFFMSILVISLNCIFWWCSYRAETHLEGLYRAAIENRIKFSIVLFISTEIIFFFSFFWSYFRYMLRPNLETRLNWPPILVGIFDFINTPLLNTIILLTSGMIVTLSHHLVRKSKMFSRIILIFLSRLLGFYFRYLQYLEYRCSFFRLNDGIFGTNFFMLTGFHGLHVLIGSLYLFIVSWRINFFTVNNQIMLRFEIRAWYWHFVDVVWIFLYFFLYYLTRT